MRTLLVIGFILGIAACGSKKKSNEPPPAQPATGAPVAFEAKSFKAGADRGGEVEVRGYNFSDQPVGQYMLLFQYKDASGAVLKVKPGTPFEKDFEFMSLSGNKYKCEPKSWCSFKVDNLDVPDKTASVEVLASRVTAIEGGKFADKPMFELPGGSMEWPGEKPAGDTGSAAGSDTGSAAGSDTGSDTGSAAGSDTGSAAAGSDTGSAQ